MFGIPGKEMLREKEQDLHDGEAGIRLERPLTSKNPGKWLQGPLSRFGLG